MPGKFDERELLLRQIGREPSGEFPSAAMPIAREVPSAIMPSSAVAPSAITDINSGALTGADLDRHFGTLESARKVPSRPFIGIEGNEVEDTVEDIQSEIDRQKDLLEFIRGRKRDTRRN